MNQKLNRPAADREVYKSQNCMEGDYDRAKKAQLDEGLVLAGNQKALTFGHQSMGAFNATQVRKLKVDMTGKKDQAAGNDEVEELPSDRRAYAQANQTRHFPAMPPPLKCSAAQIFFRGQSDRQNERAEKSF